MLSSVTDDTFDVLEGTLLFVSPVTSRVTITPNWTSQPSPTPSVTPPAPELAPLIPGHASASSPLRNGAKSTGTIRPKAGAFSEHVIPPRLARQMDS